MNKFILMVAILFCSTAFAGDWNYSYRNRGYNRYNAPRYHGYSNPRYRQFNRYNRSPYHYNYRYLPHHHQRRYNPGFRFELRF